MKLKRSRCMMMKLWSIEMDKLLTNNKYGIRVSDDMKEIEEILAGR